MNEGNTHLFGLLDKININRFCVLHEFHSFFVVEGIQYSNNLQFCVREEHLVLFSQAGRLTSKDFRNNYVILICMHGTQIDARTNTNGVNNKPLYSTLKPVYVILTFLHTLELKLKKTNYIQNMFVFVTLFLVLVLVSWTRRS